MSGSDSVYHSAFFLYFMIQCSSFILPLLYDSVLLFYTSGSHVVLLSAATVLLFFTFLLHGLSLLIFCRNCSSVLLVTDSPVYCFYVLLVPLYCSSYYVLLLLVCQTLLGNSSVANMQEQYIIRRAVQRNRVEEKQ